MCTAWVEVQAYPTLPDSGGLYHNALRIVKEGVEGGMQGVSGSL